MRKTCEAHARTEKAVAAGATVAAALNGWWSGLHGGLQSTEGSTQARVGEYFGVFLRISLFKSIRLRKTHIYGIFILENSRKYSRRKSYSKIDNQSKQAEKDLEKSQRSPSEIPAKSQRSLGVLGVLWIYPPDSSKFLLKIYSRFTSSDSYQNVPENIQDFADTGLRDSSRKRNQFFRRFFFK